MSAQRRTEVFRLRDGFHIVYQGIVARALWPEKGPAEAQLGLLRSGYSTISDEGYIFRNNGDEPSGPPRQADLRRTSPPQSPQAPAPAKEVAGAGPAPYAGTLIGGLAAAVDRVMRRNRGAQLELGGGPRAYRVRTANGSLVLCDRHVDLLRAREPAALTGETLDVGLCDHCGDEAERGRR